MAIGPANFVIVAAWLGFFIFYTYHTGARPSILSIVAIIGLAIPILPQSLLNAINYGTLKPFPVIDLGSIHLKLGLLALKYETNLSGVGPLQLFIRIRLLNSSTNLSLGGRLILVSTVRDSYAPVPYFQFCKPFLFLYLRIRHSAELLLAGDCVKSLDVIRSCRLSRLIRETPGKRVTPKGRWHSRFYLW